LLFSSVKPAVCVKEPARGVVTAICSAQYITLLFVNFHNGFVLVTLLTALTLVLKEHFAFGVQLVGLSNTVPCVAVLAMSSFVTTHVIATLGVQKSLTCFGIVIGLSTALIAFYSVPCDDPISFVMLCSVAIANYSAIHVANQARIKIIADSLTVNGAGPLTAVSRVVFAGGQALAPICFVVIASTSGYRAAFSLVLLVQALVFVVYLLLGQSLWHEWVPVTRKHDLVHLR